MRSSVQGNTPSVPCNPPNAFTASFLDRMAERDEPPTAGDADVAGPWRIESLPSGGFGLFRMGESLARGFAPVSVFPSRWLALLGAAILPGTGRDPLLLLSREPDAGGAYPLTLAGGGDGDGPAGLLRLFDEKMVDGMNVLIHVLRSPESLSYVMEAAGGVALERSGAILDERTASGA
ncbi:MAG TPA: hypothetical protein VEL74_06235 [Thermoanaerobaculia bacterium]|nr:hypothetical protein [Thermoanaerobaculia bacterium]